MDRAALDAARRAGIAHGGWCPRGRGAEDGVIPPEYALRTRQFPVEVVRRAWEERSVDEWRAIREKYGVTDAVAYDGWDLKIPPVARDGFYALFAIPE